MCKFIMRFFLFVLCFIVILSATQSETTCEPGYVLESNSQCVFYPTQFYANCTEDAECEWLGSNSVCNYVCLCEEGYHWYLGKCQKYVELGGDCATDTDCFDGYTLGSLSCIDSKCVCGEGYYQRGDYDCRKEAKGENAVCVLDIDCRDSGYQCELGKCKNSTKGSVVLEEVKDFFKIEEIKLLDYKYVAGSKCENNSNCMKNAECNNKTETCVCLHGYFFNENATQCIPELGFQFGCDTDSDCIIKPGKCVNNSCFCRDYYVVDAGKRNCIKTMTETNWKCVTNEWCYALGQYSYCNSSQVCTCSKIADYDEENEFCKFNGNDDSDMCTGDLDCMSIGGGICVNEACGCEEDFVLVENKCYPECEEDSDCEHEHYKCINQKCQCEEGYVDIDEKCYKENKNLEEACELNAQCLLPYTSCVDNVCSCHENYISHENFCYEKREFSSYCNSLLECSLSLGSDRNIQCRNRKCQCPTGYTMNEDKCSSGFSTRENLLLLLLVLILKRVVLVFS